MFSIEIRVDLYLLNETNQDNVLQVNQCVLHRDAANQFG